MSADDADYHQIIPADVGEVYMLMPPPHIHCDASSFRALLFPLRLLIFRLRHLPRSFFIEDYYADTRIISRLLIFSLTMKIDTLMPCYYAITPLFVFLRQTLARASKKDIATYC